MYTIVASRDVPKARHQHCSCFTDSVSILFIMRLKSVVVFLFSKNLAPASESGIYLLLCTELLSLEARYLDHKCF